MTTTTENLHRRRPPTAFQILREAAQLDNAELARQSGVHPQTLKRLELRLTIPTVPTLRALSRVFDMTAGELLDRYIAEELQAELAR